MNDKWNNVEFCKGVFLSQNKAEYLSLIKIIFFFKNVPINYVASKSFMILMEGHYIEDERWNNKSLASN